MIDIDCSSPPLNRFRSLHRLSAARSGHASWQHARHQLYVARDKLSRANVLIKVTSKPGLVYEQDLTNEIASLSTINRELPDARAFPVLGEHGRLSDGRAFLTMSLFDEWPLATSIGAERITIRQIPHVRTATEVATALTELHGLGIWHVDLNPMNILCRWHAGTPVIRVVDFESSYETARHSGPVFYNPPTTSRYSAPELPGQAPDARSDVFSLGAVLYTLLAGYGWTWAGDAGSCVGADPGLAPELKTLLLAAVDADPGRRYASMTELRAALIAYLEGPGLYHRNAKERACRQDSGWSP
jgi:eukaryotic-like serine/threonine-protein kinase